MMQIILASGLANELRAVPHSVELCDSSGKVLGRFIPLIDAGDISGMLIDADATDRLNDVFYAADLCAPTGQVLGRFYRRISGVDMSAWEPISPDFVSEEELDRRGQSTGRTFTTAEVIAHLESL